MEELNAKEVLDRFNRPRLMKTKWYPGYEMFVSRVSGRSFAIQRCAGGWRTSEIINKKHHNYGEVHKSASNALAALSEIYKP